MNEPVYRWQPITDAYKEESAEKSGADIEAENQQIRQELKEEKEKLIVPEKKAPLAIRIFTWYLFGRAGVYALLLFVLASFPRSDFSNWMFDSVSNFLHIPGSKGEVAKRRKAIQDMYQERGYQVPNEVLDKVEEINRPALDTQAMHNAVMLYLLVLAGLTTWVGFMWWNRSWKVRWVAMFYSGALVAKAAINFLAGAASGVGSEIPPSVMPMMMLTVAVNGFVFLYLAFGPGVSQWFEEVG